MEGGESMRKLVLIVAMVLMLAMTAAPAFAHGLGHQSASYSAWLAECYYGGYSWYDYYYHNGNYYWGWC